MTCRLIMQFSHDYLQELFTRADPYHGSRTLAGVMIRILEGPPSRPSDEQTCSRMTSRWRDICHSCWNRAPSSRPSIMDIVNEIEAKMVCPSSLQYSVLD